MKKRTYGDGTVKAEGRRFVAILPRDLSRAPVRCRKPADYRERIGTFGNRELAEERLSEVAAQRRRALGAANVCLDEARRLLSTYAGGSFVYFIHNGSHHLKIGTTKSPKTRLRHLQMGNPETLHLALVLPGDPAVESMLHRAFAPERVAGEWFYESRRLTNFVLEVAHARRAA